MPWSQLGITYTWADLRGVIMHLPLTSNFRRTLHPERARLETWMTPQVQMLGAVHDSLQNTLLLLNHVPVENLPEQGLLSGVLTQLKDTEGKEKAAEKQKEKRRGRKKSAAEIRAAVRAKEQKAT
ncbi:hypothetical protein GCM10009604_04360 [Corynebacterium aurimucosum]|uniref:hypothetical protein n=1 Tax=Corynebacterium aurimucosum TaxID=169292 RepID=UPI00191F8DC3|nr:hypothetical protein [Corynebacterium aurimucosum]QQU96681.1 hypothetical protein I6I66_06330 [Corynebacterium aurimucosum]UTA70467.1 hypothetical protein J3S22_06535 [Corynebacterium aurimucosum]WJY71006.1 hypothetical protein CAURIM_09540 [Corynebacterium aurimucosum]